MNLKLEKQFKGKTWVKPLFVKEKKMTFPTEIVKHITGESCTQCSGCHGCRGS